MQEIDNSSAKSAQSYKVESYRSLDDLVYISERLGNSAPSPHLTTWLYWAFLITNGVVFPVYLIFNGLAMLGLAVFILNLMALLFLVPRVSSDNTRKYYNRLLPTYEDDLECITLDLNGVKIEVKGSYSFLLWSSILSMEITDESIFLFTESNGVAINKSGFAYKEQELEIIRFAQAQLQRNMKELQSKEGV